MGTSKRSVAAWAGALLVLLPPAATAGVPDEKDGNWVELRSPHFTIVANGGEGAARKTAKNFEQMHAVIEAVFPPDPAGEDHPFVVVGARDEKTLRSLIPEYWEGRAEKPWGLYVPDRFRTYMPLRADIGSDVWSGRTSLPYWGYTNHVISRRLPSLPLWAHRGFVEYYAHTSVQEDRVLVGRAAEEHVRVLRERPMLPLDRLLAVDRHSPEWTAEDRRRVFDAQAWALVHYLLLGDRGAHRGALARFLEGSAGGAAAPGALGDLQQLGKQLEAYVRGAAFYTQVVQASIEVSAKEYPVRRLSAAEAYALRGGLHVAMERWADATACLDRALGLDPRLSEAQASLALMELKRDHRGEAKIAAEKALAADPKNGLAEQVLRAADARVVYGRTPGSITGDASARFAAKLKADCDAGDSGACLSLAEALISGSLGPKDVARGVALLGSRCDGGDTVVCEHLVQRYKEGRGLDKDLARAAALEEKLCGAGEARACASAGIDYLHGTEGLAADAAKAQTLLQAACDKGERNGCVALGAAFEAGPLPKNPPRAAELYAQACHLGEPTACTQAGVLRVRRQASSVEYAEAARLFERACEAGEPVGCSNLASLVRSGRGVPRDLQKARALYQKACAKGHAPACAEVTRLGGR